ncbi:MAG TPA: hypothetical protein GXZ23_06275 [Clostridiales bacterium]|nr:hypothetical protein [Clostridiales bacterium]
MSEFFLSIVNMSISASWIVLAVLLFRLLFKKAPKWIRVVLWGIVAVRLVFPFSFESILSLIPNANTISPDIMTQENPKINTGVTIVNNAIYSIIRSSPTYYGETSPNPLQKIIPVLAVIWVVGSLGLIIYTIVSYFRLKKKIGTAVLLRDNIYQSENVVSPFVLGIIKPKIYLPFNLSEQDMKHVITHEQAHINRKDHFWKPLGFLILTLHWFNPLIWFAYVLLCRDIELACDEKVAKELNTEQRADYSQALLTCSVNRRMVAACPLAFGEVGVKDRVKSILSYKKPAFWIIIVAFIASIVLAVCFLTNPETYSNISVEMSSFIEEQIIEHNHGKYLSGEFYCADFKILGTEKTKENTILYMFALYSEFSEEGGKIQKESGSLIPIAMTIEEKDGEFSLVEYWEPRDGELLVTDIREKFPKHLRKKAYQDYFYSDELRENCKKKAEVYFSLSRTYGYDVAPEMTFIGKQLTLKNVKSLSKKGNELRWKDFDGFSYFVTGSGLYIRHYIIDDLFSLLIGGTYPEEDAMYFYLQANDGSEDRIDIRTNDVDAFIQEHKNNAKVQNVNWEYSVCCVDNDGNSFEKMTEIGGVPPKAYLSSIRYLANVKITSVDELNDFKNKMSSTMNFSLTDSGNLSFNEISKAYSDEYFKTSTLFLIYTSEETYNSKFSVDYASKSLGVLSFGIKETAVSYRGEMSRGWLICIGVPNEDLQNVNSVDARISTQIIDDSIWTTTTNLLRIHTFKESKDEIKPHFVLFEDGSFEFTFSAVSDYFGVGTYVLKDNRLTLKTDDGKYVYCFDLVDDTMVFDAEASSEELWFSGMYDGCVFE